MKVYIPGRLTANLNLFLLHGSEANVNGKGVSIDTAAVNKLKGQWFAGTKLGYDYQNALSFRALIPAKCDYSLFLMPRLEVRPATTRDNLWDLLSSAMASWLYSYFVFVTWSLDSINQDPN